MSRFCLRCDTVSERECIDRVDPLAVSCVADPRDGFCPRHGFVDSENMD